VARAALGSRPYGPSGRKFWTTRCAAEIVTGGAPAGTLHPSARPVVASVGA
jgi:hypothetical protein